MPWLWSSDSRTALGWESRCSVRLQIFLLMPSFPWHCQQSSFPFLFPSPCQQALKIYNKYGWNFHLDSWRLAPQLLYPQTDSSCWLVPLNSESNIALIHQPGNCLQEAILVLLSEFHSKKYTPFNRVFQGKVEHLREGMGAQYAPHSLKQEHLFSYWGGSNSIGDKDPRKSLYSRILHTWKIQVLLTEKEKVFQKFTADLYVLYEEFDVLVF